MKRLTTTQFLLILTINVCFLLVLSGHILEETVRTVHETQTVTQYKDRIVEKCDATTHITDIMQKADTVCNDNSNNRLKNFKIDDKGNPAFSCD